jgi:hypothetical protein
VSSKVKAAEVIRVEIMCVLGGLVAWAICGFLHVWTRLVTLNTLNRSSFFFFEINRSSLVLLLATTLEASPSDRLDVVTIMTVKNDYKLIKPKRMDTRI